MAMVFIAGTWVVHLILLATLVRGHAYFDEIQVSLVILFSACALSVFALVAGVVLSHRLFGPLVSINRHIATLREGQYSARLQLRSSDDMSELKDSLNDLAEALERRHGNSPRQPS